MNSEKVREAFSFVKKDINVLKEQIENLMDVSLKERKKSTTSKDFNKDLEKLSKSISKIETKNKDLEKTVVNFEKMQDKKLEKLVNDIEILVERKVEELKEEVMEEVMEEVKSNENGLYGSDDSDPLY